MSFLLKVRCHFLDGNLCVLAGLLLSVHCSGEISSTVTTLPPRPSPFLAPCSCLTSVLMLLRGVLGSVQAREHHPVAANGLGKEECSFWHREPSCLFSHSLKAQASRRVMAFHYCRFQWQLSLVWGQTHRYINSPSPLGWPWWAELPT